MTMAPLHHASPPVSAGPPVTPTQRVATRLRRNFLAPAVLLLSCASFTAAASPTIDGTTISWPDDGWYQVQSGTDFSTICEGGRSCDVSPGIYNVINHSTGERWDHLSVASSGPVVLDIWIKLPSDGWYEVQRADTYVTVCEGISVCDVVPGLYNVINHTTGERWRNVEVTSDRSAGAPTVTGSRISWTDEGWYQVLRLDDYSVACEGGSYCDVADGDYLVINHWTGQRWSPITVSAGGSPMAPTDPVDPPESDTPLDDTPMPEDPPADPPAPSDADIQVSVASNGSETFNVAVNVPDPETGGLGGDFMVLFDRSGSFGDDLATFRRDVDNIQMALQDSFADIRVGLASFVDAPCSGFGSGSDFGYELYLALNEGGSLADTLAGLDIRGGLDGPESQLEAMRQALTGAGHTVDAGAFPACSPVADIAPSSPGYDAERVRFLLVSTDANFHRPSDPGYPYPTSVDDVITLAQEAGATVLFLNSGSTDPAAEDIAAATGGAVYNLGSASDEIVETLRTAVSTSLTSVEVTMNATGDGAAFVTSIDPEMITLNLRDDRSVNFYITLTPDLEPSPDDRVFEFELITSAAGAVISRLTVELTVPGSS